MAAPSRAHAPPYRAAPAPRNASLERVLRFIDQHFTVQGLTADHVARACHMSVRALHYLLRREQTSFATCLWSTRLRQADAWLMDREFAHFNIVDIAYMAGFRSGAHFSNAYRARFGVTPGEARSRPALSGGRLDGHDWLRKARI